MNLRTTKQFRHEQVAHIGEPMSSPKRLAQLKPMAQCRKLVEHDGA